MAAAPLGSRFCFPPAFTSSKQQLYSSLYEWRQSLRPGISAHFLQDVVGGFLGGHLNALVSWRFFLPLSKNKKGGECARRPL
jgi:hypothetical protein